MVAVLFKAKIANNGARITENFDEAVEELYNTRGFGEETDEKTLFLSPEESLFLLETGKITLTEEGKDDCNFDGAMHEFRKSFKDISQRYAAFKDLRNRGFTVKSGLKYGTHFRVYERGVRPRKGERTPGEHAKYLVHAISEGETLPVVEISRFVRLSHSVKKKLWIAVVDSDGDVTYYQTMRVTP